MSSGHGLGPAFVPVFWHARPESVGAWDSSGVPLLWRESKTEIFWTAVLDMFDVTDIVDFSGGTGALASAAISRGNHYAGFVLETKHLTWLQNTTDTAAKKTTQTKAGTRNGTQ